MVEVRNIYLSANVMQNTPVKSTVEVVNLYNTPWVNNSMSYVYEEIVNQGTENEETHYHYSGAFANCTNLKTVTGINIGNAFQNCTSMTDAPDFSSIHSGFGDNAIIMTGVFSECHNLVNTPDMGHMFIASSMSGAFYNCSNLVHVNKLPSGVFDMSVAFSNCQKLESFEEFPYITISGIPVTYRETFFNCRSLVNAPVIPNGTVNMSATYFNCVNLVNIPPLPNTVVDLSYAFQYDANIINAPDMTNCESLVNMCQTFAGCSSLVNAPIIPNSVTDLYSSFIGCSKIIDSPIIPNSVTNMSSTFRQCSSLVNAPEIPNSVTNMESSFSTCLNLINSPDFSNATNVTSLVGAFQHCFNLKNVLNLSNATNLTNLYGTFWNCTSLENNFEIPVNVTDMSQTFINCYNLSGDIIIRSEKVSSISAAFFFLDSSMNVITTGYPMRNVYIPFQNNGVNTTTYNTCTSYGYSSTTRTFDGVQLFDLNSL